MDEGVEIRRLGADDLRAYKALRDEMLDQHPLAFTSDAETEGHRRAEDYLPRMGLNRNDGGHLTLGAWDGPRLVGAISLERDMRLKVRHIGHVVGMMVRTSEQHRGVGRAMLTAALGAARAVPGLEMLTLTVTATNLRALEVYERAGFTRFGVLQRAIKIQGQYHAKVYMVNYL